MRIAEDKKSARDSVIIPAFEGLRSQHMGSTGPEAIKWAAICNGLAKLHEHKFEFAKVIRDGAERRLCPGSFAFRRN